jgi:hypothetical protein
MLDARLTAVPPCALPSLAASVLLTGGGECNTDLVETPGAQKSGDAGTPDSGAATLQDWPPIVVHDEVLSRLTRSAPITEKLAREEDHRSGKFVGPLQESWPEGGAGPYYPQHASPRR